jgi:hypothetical protein
MNDSMDTRMSDMVLDISALTRGQARTRNATACISVMIYLPRLMVGGTELAMLRLANGLLREGCRITLVLHTADGVARELAGDLAIIDLGARSTRAAMPRLARILRRERPDVLISGLTHNNIIAVAALLMSGRTCRLVVTEHAPVTTLTRARPEWRYRVLPWLLPFAYGFADAVVAVSRGAQAAAPAGDLQPGVGD